MTPTLQVTPGQRPVSAWSAGTRCAAARIALRPFSGSTPACAARPWIVIRASTMPLRELTMSPLARAHSNTNAASTPPASSRMIGVEVGEPISSSGLATNHSRSNGSSPAARVSAESAYRPVSRPPFMSVTPGPNAWPSATRNGRAAAVPGSNTVSIWPMSKPGARRADPGSRRRSCRRAWRVAWRVTVAPRRSMNPATQPATSSTPLFV